MTLKKRLFLIISIVLALITGFLILKMEVMYSSTIMLKWEEPALSRRDSPQYYAPIRMNAVFNTLLSRKCLEATINEASADLTAEELWQMTEVKKWEKDSNYFTITVTSPDKEMSAKLVNTLVKVFLDEYRAQISVTITASRESSLRDIALLKNELEMLHQQLELLYKDNNIALEYSDIKAE